MDTIHLTHIYNWIYLIKVKCKLTTKIIGKQTPLLESSKIQENGMD